MHFKIDRTAFLNELASLQGVAGAKQVIPILSHVLIETRADRITLRATDLDLMITTGCEARVREDGSICLPARKLTADRQVALTRRGRDQGQRSLPGGDHQQRLAIQIERRQGRGLSGEKRI